MWAAFVAAGGLAGRRWSCPLGLVDRVEKRLELLGDFLLARPGGDLLSHALRRSTIGAEGFHARVRDGIVWVTPRHSHQVVQRESGDVSVGLGSWSPRPWPSGLAAVRFRDWRWGEMQADRAISTGRLSALLRLYLRPIDVVVYHGS